MSRMRTLYALLVCVALPLLGEEVSLKTATGTIYGTLLLPATTPAPLAVIIAGSGPTDRNGNSPILPGPNNSLKMLAEALAANGIGSVRYDKRGVAASVAAGPIESELRFDMFVDDAAAWATMLMKDPRVSSVSFVGHSEGSLIAMIAAQQVATRSVVSISGAGRKAGDVILAQLEGQLPPDLMQTSREIIASLNDGKTVASVPQSLFAIFRPSVQPYLISWFRYDPAAEAAKLNVPLLVLQGTTDVQVMELDARLLAKAARRSSLVIIPGMNHILKDVSGDAAAQAPSYSDPTLPLDSDLVHAVVQFLNAFSRRRAASIMH
jgi:pimeloyl-ACP methyl ester carboxylesterase